ncbi:hypothetical protein A9264_05780 [Vibrio sp. UCD-FRSSP16_10]|uniref:Solitary outer membrane autotransporter beta-barrel domain n=1 Tax=unclassified Vibrio TaxID=2614977 RepID=UPI0007FE9564|nr:MULTISPECIES: Solitary outer membrane autotransporter beta-barrel domain [unclassified Vibrio]OBT07976.1 hypothetical protein A9260_08020 [Vibrio sp. UCD-FRSSP16_30]OBT17151.1 hypothetical protein A9264_05780 [Vibrio sp. UCD-FRSSP16_10]
MNRCILCLVALLVTATAHADEILKKILEQNFASAVLLSDSEAISFGFQNFNPNNFFTDNDEIGSKESLELRKQITIYTIPYTLDLPDVPLTDGTNLTQKFTFVGSYLKTERDLSFSSDPNELEDTSKEEHFTFATQYSSKYPLTKHWGLNTGIGSNLMYYRNKYIYRNSISSDLRDRLDGYAFNTDAWALTLKPSIELNYIKPQNWGHWEGFSEMKYFYGYGWGEANYGDVGNPEGWYWINGLKGFYDIGQLGGYAQSVFTSIRRIDVGGDLKDPMGTTNYYEWSAGWLMSVPFLKDYVDNIGLGLNLNYGSSLKGGTLVFLINEK